MEETKINLGHLYQEHLLKLAQTGHPDDIREFYKMLGDIFSDPKLKNLSPKVINFLSQSFLSISNEEKIEGKLLLCRKGRGHPKHSSKLSLQKYEVLRKIWDLRQTGKTMEEACETASKEHKYYKSKRQFEKDLKAIKQDLKDEDDLNREMWEE